MTPHRLDAPCSRCGISDGFIRANGPHVELRCANGDYVKFISCKELSPQDIEAMDREAPEQERLL